MKTLEKKRKTQKNKGYSLRGSNSLYMTKYGCAAE